MSIRSPIGTWMLDLASGVMTCSAACKANYGRAPDQAFDYADLAAAIVEDDRPRWNAVVESGLASGEGFEVDYRVRWPDGTIHSVIVRGSLVKPGLAMGISFDTTEQRRNEATLVAASRAKDEFMAMLGHELRNPLAPIVTALNVMEVRGPEQFVKERTIIGRQVGYLTRLVDDLLDVARITSGNVTLETSYVALGRVVASAIEVAAPLIEARRHHLTVDVAEEVGVWGDASRLAQVIANLLTNAAKYTDPGGSIAVSAHAEGLQAVIRVRDNGVGIGPEILPQIFDSFVQERQPIDRSRGGLGLGLAIVRAIVSLHGGSASVVSDGPGRGSEFVVRLPLAASTVPAAAPRTPAAARTARPSRILVVDDNVDAADLLGEALRARGHDVRVAYDGPTALEVLAGFAPETAILDIGLPVMDGYELARRIRDDRRLAVGRLIALTGYAGEADRQRTTEAGFDAHLVKPIDLANLDAIIAGDCM